MRKISSAVLASTVLLVAAGCSDTRPADAGLTTAPAGPLLAETPGSHGGGTLTEPAAFNNRVCELRFPGSPSQNAQMYAIWNLGHGILDATFDTDRPDLYAIIPGTMHTDPNYPQFNHDHIVSAAPGVPGYDGTWDVWLVLPGPNFDAATYQAPRSVTSMMDLIAQGVLAQPIGFSQAGLGVPDLVLRAPLLCTGT